MDVREEDAYRKERAREHVRDQTKDDGRLGKQGGNEEGMGIGIQYTGMMANTE